MVDGPVHARLFGTMSAAIESLPGLDAVADDLAAAMRTDRREFVYRTFERVKNVPLARRYNFKR